MRDPIDRFGRPLAADPRERFGRAELAQLLRELDARERAIEARDHELRARSQEVLALRRDLAGRTEQAEALRQRLEVAVAEVERARTDAERLQAELGLARRELDQARSATPEAPADGDRVVRLAADLANLRRHQQEAIDRAVTQSRREVLGDLADVLDAVDRALDTAEVGSPWHEGTQAVQRLLEAVMVRHGAERLGVVGEPFDPRSHEAIGMIDSDVTPEHVAQVLQSGWRLPSGALVRPARVLVSAGLSA